MSLANLENSLKLWSKKFIPSHPTICQVVPCITPIHDSQVSIQFLSLEATYLRSILLCTLDYFSEKMIKNKKFINAFYSPSGPFSYELLFPSFYVAAIQPCSL